MNKKISVLIVGYEAAPFYKRGGLGDVMESLPKALNRIGVEIRAVIPYYDDIKEKYSFEKEGEFTVAFGSETEHLGIYSSVLPNTKVPFYFLQNKNYLSLSRAKNKTKRMIQFAFFDLAVVNFIHYLGKNHKWHPTVIHCNDWHTGLIPLILKKMKLAIPTLLTIHNLLYQGVGSLKILDLLDIEDEEAKELKRGVPANEMNVLGEGIIHATRVSTVSRSYAKEIMADYDKNPIYPFLKKRAEEHFKKDGEIVGILNGIDYDIWNPKTDEFLFYKYDIDTWEIGKRDNKKDLLKELGLSERPTFCFIGRLAEQKGLGILIKAIDGLESLNINMIILGEGNSVIQESVLKLAQEHPSWIRTELIYSEELAHKLYAGSDFIIIPSRYEPCGLIQMIAMHYGTLPIASKTGGLQDSIKHGKNGLLFKKGKVRRLNKAIEHGLNIKKHSLKYRKIVEYAMKADFSWDKSAVLYKKLYEGMVNSP